MTSMNHRTPDPHPCEGIARYVGRRVESEYAAARVPVQRQCQAPRLYMKGAV